MIGLMRSIINWFFVIFVLLAAPGMVWARPDDMSQSDWAEIQRTKKEEVAPVVSVEPTPAAAEVVEESDEEVVANIDGTDVRPESEWTCIGSRIQSAVFWVPDSCFQEGLSQIQAELGGVDLWCQRGYMGAPNEITVTPKEQADWPLCTEFTP